VDRPPPLEDLDHAAVDDLEGRQPVDALAAELDAALGDVAPLGAQQAGDGLEGGGLAGPVGPEQRGDAPLAHLERDALEHEDDAVVDDLGVDQDHHAPAPAGRSVPAPSCSSDLGPPTWPPRP